MPLGNSTSIFLDVASLLFWVITVDSAGVAPEASVSAEAVKVGVKGTRSQFVAW